jgi:hypothetical protein
MSHAPNHDFPSVLAFFTYGTPTQYLFDFNEITPLCGDESANSFVSMRG